MEDMLVRKGRYARRTSTFSLLINSFVDVVGRLLFVMVVPSRIDGDVETLIISGKCEVESTTRLFAGLESFAVEVAILA